VSPTARVQMDLSAAPARKGGERRRSNLRYNIPPVGINDDPVVVRDEPRDLTLVRIRRSVTKSGALYLGSQIVTVEDVYLDGTWTTKSYTEDRKHQIEDRRETMPAESTIRAARTKDTIDFGRFEQACVALMTQVDQVKAKEGDDVQEEAVWRGYQGLLAWREELARQVLAVDASIDVVRAKIVDMVQ
jgi:hypothetical protein